MKTLSSVALALVLATGAALAQGSGGGTDTGPGGTNTGKDSATMNPTPQECAQGWNSSMRMTKTEFDQACKKQ
jgi:hypothetical protein